MAAAGQGDDLVAAEVALLDEDLKEARGRVGLGLDGPAGLDLVVGQPPAFEGESDDSLVARVSHRGLLELGPAS
ncbi:MAG: hypothetical protein ACOC8D_01940 [bacterium]